MKYIVDIRRSRMKQDAWWWRVATAHDDERVDTGYAWTKWGAKRRITQVIRDHKRELLLKAQEESYTVEV